jgi:hypothetical protein
MLLCLVMLYMAAKPSHVGADVNVLAYSCTVQRPVAVRGVDSAA